MAGIVFILGHLFILFTGLAWAEPNKQSPVFRPEERYQDMFHLTKENFTENLLRSRDPWIVIFHDGNIAREWKTMATHLRGLCWIGLIDVNVETDLLSVIEYDSSEGVARFYPYGDRKTKERSWRSVKNQNEARAAALASIPDKTQKISGDSVRDLLLDCFTSRPSKFPAYVITDEDETPSVFKAIAKRFEKYFTFARVVRPSDETLKKLGLGEGYINPPALFVIVTQDGHKDTFDAIKFDTDRMGALNYTNILQFLFAINSQFRHELPGDNMSQFQQESEMSDIVQIEAKRFEILTAADSKPRQTPRHEPETADDNFNLKITKHVGMKDEL